MSASPNYEIKKDPIDDDDDDDIEILSNITNKKENRNNLMCSASVLAKSEFNTTTNRRIESKNDIKKIKQLEQMQEILFERIRIISNENEILKQNETNLMATNNELNRNIEIKTNDQMNLSNEITSLKENLFKAQETIELKTTEMNDLRIKIDEYELKINEMNLVSKIKIEPNNQIYMKDEKIKQLEQIQKILMETVQNKANEIEILKRRNEANNHEQFTCALNDPLATQSMELRQQSEEYKKLESNLRKIKLLVNNLNNFASQSIQELNKHCQEQKRLVESATELKIKNLENKSKKRKYNNETNVNQEENIDQINKSKRELIEVIDNFELTCIEEFLTKINTVKIKEQLDETNLLVLKIFTENPRFNRSHK